MKNYCAKTVENVVTEIIVADINWANENLEGEWHDLGHGPLEIAINWTYDPTTNIFNPPPAPVE